MDEIAASFSFGTFFILSFYYVEPESVCDGALYAAAHL